MTEFTECNKLQKYLDGDLCAHNQAAFERHLTGCPGCASAVAQWTEFTRVARQDAAHQALRSTAAEHITQQQLEASFSRQLALSPWQKLSFAPLLAAAAAVCVAAGIFWIRFSEPSPKPVTPAPTAVQITRFAVNGSIRQTTGHRGAPIAATPDEQLLATVGKDQVAVGPNARMVISRNTTQSTHLALNNGWIACHVAKRDGGRRFVTHTQDRRFKVVVKGTRFGVQYHGSRNTHANNASPLLQVAVTEGIVQIEETHGRTWTVSAGEQLVVERDGAAEVTPLSSQNRTIVTSLLNPSAAPSALSDALAQTHPGLDQTKPNHFSPVLQRRERAKTPGGASRETTHPNAAEPPPVTVAELRQWIGDGRYAAAINVLEKHLLKEPGNCELWRLLAESKRRVGDYQGAVAAYQQVINSAPAQLANAARYKMGLLYQNQLHQPANAITQFSRYLAEDEPQLLRAEALYHLGKAEYSMGQRASARAHLNEVIGQHGATAAAVQARKLLQRMKE